MDYTKYGYLKDKCRYFAGIGTLFVAAGLIASGCTGSQTTIHHDIKLKTTALPGRSLSNVHRTGAKRQDLTLTNPTSTKPTTADRIEADIVDGRFVHPVTIGGLHIVPANSYRGSAPLGLNLATATSYAGFTGGISWLGKKIVGWGIVTLSGVTMPSGTPILTNRLAWVGIALGTNTGVYNCPAMTAPITPRKFIPSDAAVIFYGQNGEGAITYNTGGSDPCGDGTSGPGVAIADAVVPVAWHQVTPASLYHSVIAYQAPVCAHSDGTDGSGNMKTGVNTINVVVSFPFDRIAFGCQAVKQFTTTVFLYPSNPGPGAPPPPSRIILEHSTAPAFVPPSLVGPITPQGHP